MTGLPGRPSNVGHPLRRCAAAVAALACVALIGSADTLTAQARRTTPAPSTPPSTGRGAGTPAARRAPAQAPPKVEAAEVKCPMPLGDGANTGRAFCDVQIGNSAADGIIVTIPAHTGDVMLIFDLHNRHTYSEQQVKNNRGYHRYAATIGVMTMDTTLISRAAIISEFRTEADLVDRIGGGTGPGGLKAVAPTGTEPVVITIPAEFKAEAVSILGEKLNVVRVDAVDDFSAPGRPIAVISNVILEYRPAPARRTAPARR